MSDADSKFSQIYFMGDEEQQMHRYMIRIQPYRADGGTKNCRYFGKVFAKP